ncbi:hypothetical protein AVEN_211268-1 [Araneus ventricosus]|uniref:Uncharacterized protein n=1 Tax=Araneus ventricosus TaxID=182803 RepID=A0A4Y2NH91_ARAVE|nr:hypothetical protein AVEN_211268-1 [Araneus ventricosus]
MSFLFVGLFEILVTNFILVSFVEVQVLVAGDWTFSWRRYINGQYFGNSEFSYFFSFGSFGKVTPQKDEKELAIIYSSVKKDSSSSSLLHQSFKGILEIYTSLDSQGKTDFLETLSERERQALFNSLKDSPTKLQEWEDLFKNQTENLKATVPTHSQDEPTASPSFSHPVSLLAEKEGINKSLYHLREIIHFKEGVFKIPATLRSKAEEYFTSIESQFNKLLSAIQVAQDNSTKSENKSTQASLPSPNFEEVSEVAMLLPSQGPPNIPPSVQIPHVKPPSLLLHPTEQTSELETDLHSLLQSNLPSSKAKIANIKKIN